MKHPLHLLACSFALLCLTSITAHAQDDEETSKLPQRRQAYIDPTVSNKEILSIGLHGGIGLLQHSGEFSTVPSQPAGFHSFTGGSGTGIVAGIDLSLPLTNTLRFLGRVQFQGMNGTFDVLEPTTVRIGNEAQQTSFRHAFDASLSMIAIEPAVEYMMGGVGLVGGLRVGIVSAGTYVQTQELQDKSINYVFPNGTTQYTNRTGDLEDMATVQFGMVAGIRYHIAAGSNLRIVPEVMYAPNFTSLNDAMQWSASSFRFGASIMLTLWGKNVIATPLTPR
jgi:hypothetical protein